MTNQRPLHLLFGGLAILLAAQVLNHVQVQASTEKALTQAQVSQKLVAARDLKASLERGMGFGKPLALFSGTDKLFDSLRSRYEGITFLAVTGPNLEAYAQTDPGVLPALAPQDLPAFPTVNPPGREVAAKTLVRGQQILVSLPLYFNDKDLKGEVWLGFSRGPLETQLAGEGAYGLAVLGIFASLTGLAFLGLFFLLVRRRDGRGPADVSKKFHLPLLTRISLAIVSVLLVGILGYSFSTTGRFTAGLVQTYEQNVTVLARSQAAELQRLLVWDLAPDHWQKAETLLAAQVRHTPEVQVLALTDPQGKTLYSADRTSVYPGDSGKPAPQIGQGTGWVKAPLADPNGATRAFLWGKIDQSFLDSINFDRFLDALTVTLVSLVFSVELLLVLGVFAGRPRELSPSVPTPDSAVKVIRFTAFLFFLAELLPLPFMPLYIADLYSHSPLAIFQLSPDAVRGIPFSAHLFGVMVFVPLVGALTNRVSLRTLFVTSGLLLLAGNVLAAFSGNLALLIVWRFVSGLGYGGVLAASGGLVVQTTSKENRTSGFAGWGAGFAAASICAVVLGGILANHVGYRNGLLVSAGISVALGAFVLAFHPRKAPAPGAAQVRKPKLSDLFAPFRDRTALLTLLFASIPVQLAFFGLFQYTLPLVMDQAGLSEANIGRILTIYGLISLGSPLLARYADRTRNEKRLIVLGNLVTGVFLMLFFLQGGLWSIILVVAAIGIGGLLFDTVISSFLSLTKASETHGEAAFLSIFLTWEKLFTVFIPVLVGTLMTSLGYLPSAALLGVVIAVGALVFALLVRGRPQAEKETR
jgi:predicted MFS family arabinose efflux permease